jgi:hypothetical protein
MDKIHSKIVWGPFGDLSDYGRRSGPMHTSNASTYPSRHGEGTRVILVPTRLSPYGEPGGD